MFPEKNIHYQFHLLHLFQMDKRKRAVTIHSVNDAVFKVILSLFVDSPESASVGCQVNKHFQRCLKQCPLKFVASTNTRLCHIQGVSTPDISTIVKNYPSTETVWLRHGVTCNDDVLVFLKQLPSLTHLKMNYSRVHGNELFVELSNLKSLELRYWDTNTSLQFKEIMNYLQRLCISHMLMQNIEFITQAPHLLELNISYQDVGDVGPVLHCKQLRSLTMRECFNISNEQVIGQLHDLVCLNLEGSTSVLNPDGTTRVFDLEFLQLLLKLQILKLPSGSTTDLSKLQKLLNLEELWVVDGGKLCFAKTISILTNLQNLTMINCTFDPNNPNDKIDFSDFLNLSWLDLHKSRGIGDLSSLRRSPLETLYFPCCLGKFCPGGCQGINDPNVQGKVEQALEVFHKHQAGDE
jgi:hypothetical protein